MVRLQVLALSSLLFISPITAVLGAGPEYVVVRATINPVTPARGVTDALAECAKDNLCSGVVDATATYFGAPPGAVTGAMAAIPTASGGGEDRYYEVALPAGYQYCHSHIEFTSVNPPEGARASVLGAWTQKSGVKINTWTGKRPVFDGRRSWIQADLTIMGVRDDMADTARLTGTCKPYGVPTAGFNTTVTLINCRGDRGVPTHGQPLCRPATD